jgi:hypothetical protein
VILEARMEELDLWGRSRRGFDPCDVLVGDAFWCGMARVVGMDLDDWTWVTQRERQKIWW